MINLQLFKQSRYHFIPKKKKKKVNRKGLGFLKTSQGEIVQAPLDALGQLYDSWPFALFQRSDEIFIIIDRRRPLGNMTIGMCSDLEEAVNKFKELESENAIL